MTQTTLTNTLVERAKNPQFWGFFVSMAILALISLAFFYPDSIDGASLQQSDIRQGIANGQEAKAFEEATGEKALWTNSLFGGMPTFQISPSYPSNSLFTWLDTVYGLGLPAPSNLLFMMMFGMLILLFVMKLRWYYALLGAIAWGLSSYFVIIIGAGHIWKFITLAYIPPTIAGLVLVYRGCRLAGGAMLALFAMLQLNANHPQMSYYFFFVMLAMVIAWLVTAVRERRVRQWCMSSAVALGAGMIALGANLPSIYNTYEYAKETKRAQSELTQPTTSTDASQRPTGGMPYDQIVGWSYGRAESLSLIVPNIKGGASARPESGRMTFLGLDQLPDAAQLSGTAAGALLPYLSQYFNDSEGTNGPVYVGVLIFALALLACFIVKGPMKWALAVMTLISILLALGRNFGFLTDLMIYNFPLYNKFRAVESILVIAEFTIPLLAVLGLHTLLTTDDALRRFRRPILWSVGFTLVVCLAAMFIPSIFGEAITSTDHATVQSIQKQLLDQAAQYNYNQAQTDAVLYQYALSNPTNLSAIEGLRFGMVKADGLRSLMFLLVGVIVIALTCRRTIKPATGVLLLTAVVLIDLYGVDKRYVSHSSFAAPTAASAPMIAADEIDSMILADADPDYRVLDIPGFDLPDRSFYHKMVGGYHAAKLNRYEDLIQRKLRQVNALGYYPELRDDSVAAQYHEGIVEAAHNYRVLDMLNVRYVITGERDYPVIYNDQALGNAWIVDDIVYVDGADAEMAALGEFDPATTAVADSRFRSILGEKATPKSLGDTIYLTDYTPNRLTYEYSSANGGVAVFSEIYFPWGWRAQIDGRDVEIGRVNYVLRALDLEPGEHEIVMTFDPKSMHVTSAVAYTCIILIYLLCVGAIVMQLRRKED